MFFTCVFKFAILSGEWCYVGGRCVWGRWIGGGGGGAKKKKIINIL